LDAKVTKSLGNCLTNSRDIEILLSTKRKQLKILNMAENCTLKYYATPYENKS
jgi:hypothetical protein